MVLPPSKSSRLSALKNARHSASKAKQTGIADFLKKGPPIVPAQHQHHRASRPSTSQPLKQPPLSAQQPPQRQRQKSPILSETQNTSTSVQSNKILNGVVACLDVRTEDGDDVSQNFERALQSMGAKTRRTFSEWVTSDTEESHEQECIHHQPAVDFEMQARREKTARERLHNRTTTGACHCRKEETKVNGARQSESTRIKRSGGINDGSVHDDAKVETRRQTIATSNWIARDFKKPSVGESLTRKRQIQEAEAYDEEIGQEILPPRLSLPISVESIANRHIAKKQKTPITIPVHAPSLQMKEQIKARFSIGQAPTSNPVTKPSSTNNSSTISSGSSTADTKLDDTLRLIDPSKLSISTPTQVSSTPIKRKRRLTGSLTRPSLSGGSITTSQPPKPETSAQPQTIVLTSVTPSTRKRYEDIIKKLGHYQLATEVTETTSHVLAGAQRRTKSVTLGFLRGAWILSPEWLIQCEIKGEYIPENSFELLDWYPRAKAARQRERLIPSTTRIKVHSSSSGVDFIKELVKLAGGTVVENDQEADIIICDKTEMLNDKRMVTDHWLFESIEHWKCAVGAAAVYVNRRNSQSSETENMSPIALARRRSSTVQFDPEWSSRKQPEILWRRDNGVSFSHNSKPKYPTGQKDLQQSSSASK
ncbi:hypothetical protein MBANPS3_011326 [Mucor bainieri]